MEKFKTFLILSLVFLSAILIYFSLKPTHDPKIDFLEKKCDSLQVVISCNKNKIDSIQNETQKLITKSNKLSSELSNINKKAKDLKKQHEKDIAHINSLSNNDIAHLFTNEFKDIE